MRVALSLLASILAGAAGAQDIMTAEEFEAYAEGRTLGYAVAGQSPYGLEAYRPGRRVLYDILEEECHEGVWYPKGDQICFLYETLVGEKCWLFTLTEDGLRGTFTSDPDDATVYGIAPTDEPLRCLGPEVGV